MNPDQTAPSLKQFHLGPYCLPYRPPQKQAFERADNKSCDLEEKG